MDIFIKFLSQEGLLIILGVALVIPWVLIFVAGWQVSSAVNRLRTEMADTREQTSIVMANFEQRYVNNVSLVKRYNELAGDLSQVVHLNAQTMTELVVQTRFNTELLHRIEGKK